MPPVTVSSPAPRVSPWEWAQAALLAGNLAWTTLALGGFRAETRIVTLMLTSALVVVHFLTRALARGGSPRVHPAGWLLLPFLVYAAANAQWVTPVRWLGWMDWLGWAQMVAVFWVTLNGVRASGPRRLLFLMLVLLGIVGVACACYQRFVRPDWMALHRLWPGDLEGRASGTFGLPNSFAGFLLLLLPAMGALAFRRSGTAMERVWWGWVAVVLSFGLMLTLSRGAFIALALALIAWPLWAAHGGWWRRIRIAVTIMAGVAIVGGAIIWKVPKVRARMHALVLNAGERTRPIMWRAAWALVREQPALGTGAGSYNVLLERHRPAQFPDNPLWAHNEYLNTLSDYGFVGAGLFWGACGFMAWRCMRAGDRGKTRRSDWLESPTVVAALGVGLLAFGLQMGLEFHLKIPALALMLATTAGLVVSRTWPGGVSPAECRPPQWTAIGYGIAGVAGALMVARWGTPLLRAEAWREAGRYAIDRLAGVAPEHADFRSGVERSVALLQCATELHPANGQAWADLSYATSLLSNLDQARRADIGRDAERAAEKALQGPAINFEFWVRRGVARDLQGRWEEATPDFFQAVKLAPNNAYAWFYLAEHLYRFNGARGAGLAALETCLRLDPGNPPGLALRQRLAFKTKPN